MKTLTITKETTVNEIENWLHGLPGEAVIRTTLGNVVAKLDGADPESTYGECENFWRVAGELGVYTDEVLAKHIQDVEPETTIEVIYQPKREPLCETLYISMPMAGRTREEIKAERARILHDLEQARQETFHLIPLIDEDELNQMTPAEALGESIKRLAQATIVIFADGWENARGCQIEKAVCDAYGINHRA